MNTIPTEYRLEGDGTSIQSLPKISLHDHLDGGLRPQSLIELADEIGLEVPAPDAEALGTWFTDQANAGSLVEYLKTFDLTTAVMQTRTGLQRVAREFVQDLAADGVIYGEIRWAPEQHLERGLSLDEAVEAVQSGIEEGIDDVRHQGRFIRAGQLVTAMRHADRGLEIAELAVDDAVDGEVEHELARDPLEARAGLHDGRGEVERLQVLDERTGVGLLGEPRGEALGVGGRHLDPDLVGELDERLRAEAAVEMIVQRDLRQRLDARAVALEAVLRRNRVHVTTIAASPPRSLGNLEAVPSRFRVRRERISARSHPCRSRG